ncbi:hypothetical protein ABT282_32445 [Streptomyces sp. NPDC000927]|uniref:hypothetical protein n=1 Tax=unclassified Streptomyces TaxID=2593676 RepID=UPI003320E4E0
MTVRGAGARRSSPPPRLAAARHGGRYRDAYKAWLGAQGPRFSALGIDCYRAPEVPWSAESPGAA